MDAIVTVPARKRENNNDGDSLFGEGFGPPAIGDHA
jgi:hypothetical protein